MSYVSIMSSTPESRVSKYAEFATQQEALNHVANFAGQYPQAFVAEKPAAPVKDWKVTGNTLTIDVPPLTASEIDSAELEAEKTALKNDAWVTSFLNMTPDQARQFIIDNTASLSDARTHLSRMAYVLRILVRREFGK